MSVPFDEEARVASAGDSSVDGDSSGLDFTQVHQPTRRKAVLGRRAIRPMVREIRAPVHRKVWSTLLDEAYLALQNKQGTATLERVFVELNEMKAAAHPDWWQEFCEVDSLAHPIRELFHEDPFTLRSFEKPRGYAGDAVMLDYIYGERPIPEGTPEIGRQIFDFTTHAPASQSVRARRDVLVQYIDRAATEHVDPRILAIACGHLREAAHSSAMDAGRIHNLFAFDQDVDSLALIEENHSSRNIKTIQGSIKGILSGKSKFEDMDLVYAAGLYDYLGDRVAIRLTRQIFDMLAPGGRLLIANFAPTLRDIGYMETYMGWKLIYRNAEDMRALSAEIPPHAIASDRVFDDEFGNIVFLEITKGA
jgi:extracellular factor (EF) 3-hydroxypalmitic acid methyl ester biosynthesis protein